MKKMSLAICFLMSIATSAFAEIERCERPAAKAVEQKFRAAFFDGNRRVRQIELIECETRISRKNLPYVACDLEASTRKGTGTLSFTVIQNNTCTRVFAAFVTGRE